MDKRPNIIVCGLYLYKELFRTSSRSRGGVLKEVVKESLKKSSCSFLKDVNYTWNKIERITLNSVSDRYIIISLLEGL